MSDGEECGMIMVAQGMGRRRREGKQAHSPYERTGCSLIPASGNSLFGVRDAAPTHRPPSASPLHAER